MKSIAHFEFESPKIIGVLSDRNIPAHLQKRLDGLLKRRRIPYVCLPFRVEPKYLKNVIACMRIMDIEGLIVLGDHARRLARSMAHLTKSAKKAGFVNAIERRKNRFHGHYIQDGRNFYSDAVGLLTSRSSKNAT